MALIPLLITALIFALICYLIFWMLGYLGAPEPIRKVVTVIIVVIAVLWLLEAFMPGSHLVLWPPGFGR